jgi:hypothetical protein
MAITSYLGKNGETLWKVSVSVRSSSDPSIRVQKAKFGFATEREAEREETKLLRECERSVLIKETHGSSWESVLEAWAKNLDGSLSQTTRTDYVACAYKNTSSWLKRPAAGITPLEVKEVLNQLKAEGRTYDYVKYLKNLIGRIFMFGDEIQEMLGLLWHKGARRFIYLGSAGALDPAIQVGDLVVPAEFSEPGGRWRTFSNGAGELPIALAAPLKIIRGVRQGTVSTLIEETRERMENLAGLGIQAIDIEANHFARFFDGREAQTSIILAITDLPLGGVKLDEGYEVNFAAVKSICQVFPHLIDFPRTS